LVNVGHTIFFNKLNLFYKMEDNKKKLAIETGSLIFEAFYHILSSFNYYKNAEKQNIQLAASHANKTISLGFKIWGNIEKYNAISANTAPTQYIGQPKPIHSVVRHTDTVGDVIARNSKLPDNLSGEYLLNEHGLKQYILHYPNGDIKYLSGNGNWYSGSVFYKNRNTCFSVTGNNGSLDLLLFGVQDDKGFKVSVWIINYKTGESNFHSVFFLDEV